MKARIVIRSIPPVTPTPMAMAKTRSDGGDSIAGSAGARMRFPKGVTKPLAQGISTVGVSVTEVASMVHSERAETCKRLVGAGVIDATYLMHHSPLCTSIEVDAKHSILRTHRYHLRRERGTICQNGSALTRVAHTGYGKNCMADATGFMWSSFTVRPARIVLRCAAFYAAMEAASGSNAR